ncbi:IclR family transcriptional regulator [Neobacillus bataviensis LMG 21833]|uniref:IclR family transcriptional regulator n=1 Tax=Neobacillus bataviensis LMG 21833 TaxID=1117379 RepID=K6CKG4_9BACI|nr:IclR family transcriptional regulator [Neobacillus bataviensis]EKN71640.1 IclR family transcriptional regulator [Neobacillus bataviensis LMG 21833]
MKEKYWVPAIERADKVLKLIGEYPNQLRLIELSKRADINKSSLFSLLNTLETLKWVTKEDGDSYSLGPALAAIGSSYFRQFNILQSFYKEASQSVSKINEHIQLGILDEGDVVYLGKMEGDSRVRLITDPGMRFPAYASAIGKIQLTPCSKTELEEIFPDQWESKTPFTISNIDALYENVQEAKRNGYAIENQEASLGFHCVAAPVYNFENKIIAGVSFTMMTSSWEQKKDAAREEILQLASRLSQLAGFTGEQKQRIE